MIVEQWKTNDNKLLMATGKCWHFLRQPSNERNVNDFDNLTDDSRH